MKPNRCTCPRCCARAMSAWEPAPILIQITMGVHEISTCAECGAKEARVTPGRESELPANDRHMGAA